MKTILSLSACCVLASTLATAQPTLPKTNLKFDFGSGKTEKGYMQVLPTTQYTKEAGYGFTKEAQVSAVDRGGKDALKSDFITSDKPFYFTVDVPEGNYDVKVTLGDKAGESTTTVRAESRRLMLDEVVTKTGQLETRSFTVNVRYPQIDAQEKVRLKSRELAYLNWDNQLTLEFNGPSPKVCAVEITRNDKATTVFLAGNSTVVDQDREPWAAWGQMIPRFFKPGNVAIANHAESGEALKSFVSERRLAKILSLMKPGDYLFIEFAHNDQKRGSAYVEPFTTYKEQLKLYISEARKRGGIPVLVTSMHRRNFDSTGHINNTLGDYPEAVRQTGAEEKVAVIDLNAMSKTLYEAWGPEQSIKAFVHYPANSFPGQTQELKDNTHFSTYGAYEIARCMMEGIKANVPDLAKHLMSDIAPFNPAQPDPIAAWHWPLSPMITALRPDGN
ncbi:rhamnogalacturonan acetylesterase [Spirosoma soli]|uniref:Rhamnogalacturonan acetylesterase n=1 Tax=Spirosoma soli TaxID=1770529 RepID=A0ABW5LWK7_9BACT